MHVARLAGLADDAHAHAFADARQVMVHGPHRQQHRHRDARVVHVAVAQDDQPAAVVHGGLDLPADPVDGAFQPVRAVVRGPESIDRRQLRLGSVVGAERLQFVLEEKRRLRLDQPRVLGRFAEQIAPPTHDGVQRHDQPFAQRVDGRVRHLREKLAEIRVEQPRLEREHGQRRVVAHGPVRLRAFLEHGLEDHVEFLAAVAEGDLALGQGEDVEFLRGLGQGVAFRQGGQPDHVFVEPLAVRLLGGEAVLDVGVPQEGLANGIDRDHLARAEAAFLDDVRVVEFHHAHLRAEGEDAVVGQLVPRRAQAVAVQARADGVAVAEHQRRRAVPGFVKARVVLVERREFRAHVRVAAPRGGHEHRHRVEDVAPAHHEGFEGVVQARAVRTAGLDDRLEQVDVRAPEVRRKLRLAGTHPVAVALDGVDLAVVAEHAEGLPERPRREGVRAVTLVVDAQRRLVGRVGEVAVEVFQRRGNQQPLVDDDPARHRRDVEILDLVGGGALLDLVAGEEQLALVLVRAHAPGLADERLFDARHGELRLVAEDVDVRRHLAPAEEEEFARFEHLFRDGLHAGLRIGVVVRQEEEPDAEVLVLVQVVAAFADLRAQDVVRELGQQPRAVARLGVGVERAAVDEVAKRLDAVAQHAVRAHAADVGDEPGAAGVVFVFRSVERCPLARGFLHGFVHRWRGVSIRCPAEKTPFPYGRSVGRKNCHAEPPR